MRVRSVRLGWVLLACSAATALIALNRGIDLLWGIALLLLLATFLALVLPFLQLRGVRVRRAEFPVTAVVGEDVTIAYDVDVPGVLPRYGIEIYDALAGGDALMPTAFLPHARGRRRHTFSWTPQSRGLWQLRDLRIESRYPLGFAQAARLLAADARELVVYPDFVKLRWLPVDNDAYPRFEQSASSRRGGHDEPFGLRQYAVGDEVRAIHWRSSARRGDIVVREFEHHQDRQLWMFLELSASRHAGDGQLGTMETMIRIAHSIAMKAQDDGIPVGLVYRVADAVQQIPAAADRSTYLRIRDALARVGPHAQLPIARWMLRVREQLPEGGAWVLFNLGSARERAVLERLAARRRAQATFIEFDRDSFARGAPVADMPATSPASPRATVSTIAWGADLTQLFRP